MSVYLERYAFEALKIEEPTNPETGLIVVIPVYNEPNLLPALESLYRCKLPHTDVEVIIVLNEAESCEKNILVQNNVTFTQTQDWIQAHKKSGLQFFLSRVKLPNKHAGVGLARKAGMDEAVRRFDRANNQKGIILCYDADCTCSTNYLSEVVEAFDQLELGGASIYFEHPTDLLKPNEQVAIVQYELHLRYYVNALRQAGYPYAYHTIGSSMAVRSDVYQKAGGMNKRKAGEDFHFLHKIIPYGNYGEINKATVYPSARISDRVPFGTGKAMGAWKEQNMKVFNSYDPQIFDLLKLLLKQVPKHYKATYEKAVYELPKLIIQYLEHENYEKELKRINRQSISLISFIHKWFLWFNGLRALHFVHFMRDNAYPSLPVAKAASRLYHLKTENPKELLEFYRNKDRAFKSSRIDLKNLYSLFQ